MAHPEIGRGLLDQLAESLRTHATIEQAPKMEGRTMTLHLAPLKAKASLQERDAARERETDAPASARTDERDATGSFTSPDTTMAAALQAVEGSLVTHDQDQDEDPQGRQEAV